MSFNVEGVDAEHDGDWTEECDDCSGGGIEEGMDWCGEPCRRCGGKGYVFIEGGWDEE